MKKMSALLILVGLSIGLWSCSSDIIIEDPPGIEGNYIGTYEHKESNDGAVNIMHIVWEFTFDGTWHMDRDTTMPGEDCFCLAFGTFTLTDRVSFKLNDGSNQPVQDCDGCDKNDGPDDVFAMIRLGDTLKLVQSLEGGEVKTLKLLLAP